MFTGIIENTGVIRRWQPSPQGGKLFILPRHRWERMRAGESVAVNGCCLTVVSCKINAIEFDISDETMRKTALDDLGEGDTVNLERAMRTDGRFGGHFVLGHVDGVGKIKNVIDHPGSIEYVVTYPRKFSRLLIEKGSVAVDGISLTVCNLARDSFSVYIIPHTLRETNLDGLQRGASVNLEFDVIGKYVARGRAV